MLESEICCVSDCDLLSASVQRDDGYRWIMAISLGCQCYSRVAAVYGPAVFPRGSAISLHRQRRHWRGQTRWVYKHQLGFLLLFLRAGGDKFWIKLFFFFLFVCNMRMKALRWLWPEDDLMMELEDMMAERKSTQGKAAKTVKEALTSRSVRWQILTLVFPCAGVQFCGVTAVCSALNTVTDSSMSGTNSSVFCPAVFLRLWHLPWVRRAREPDAIPGLRYWSNRANSCYSVCECLHKWSKKQQKSLEELVFDPAWSLAGFCR